MDHLLSYLEIPVYIPRKPSQIINISPPEETFHLNDLNSTLFMHMKKWLADLKLDSYDISFIESENSINIPLDKSTKKIFIPPLERLIKQPKLKQQWYMNILRNYYE